MPDFNFLMERRKNDQVWGKLFYIQSASISKDRQYEVKFHFEREKEKDLFKRAKEDISSLLNMLNYWDSKSRKEEV